MIESIGFNPSYKNAATESTENREVSEKAGVFAANPLGHKNGLDEKYVQQEQDDYIAVHETEPEPTQTYTLRSVLAPFDNNASINADRPIYSNFIEPDEHAFQSVSILEESVPLQPSILIDYDPEDDGGYIAASIFVTNIYMKYLGHFPDTVSSEFWISQILDFAVPQNSVFAQIAYSTEGLQYTASLEAQVTNVYLTEVGHAPDAASLIAGVNLLRNNYTTVAQFAAQIHSSTEAVAYRANRIAAMHNYGSLGLAVVSRISTDTLQTLAQDAYGRADQWWVIAQANGVMMDSELSALATIVVPNIVNSSWNPQTVMVGDTGYAYVYSNMATGDEFFEYYIPAASQLDPLEYEENPSWLSGLSFVNGNSRSQRSDFYISRGAGNPILPADYWKTHDTSIVVDSRELAAPLIIDTALLGQLPVYSASDAGAFPPPPVIRSTSGSDPSLAAATFRRLPDGVSTALKLSGISIVTVRGSVVEFAPELSGRQIPGWQVGITWDSSPGAFLSRQNAVVIATGPEAKLAGSENLALHEIAHAYDFAMGVISRSPLFEAAFRADHNALINADPRGYFARADPSPPDSAVPATAWRAQGETYAESFANYYSGNAKWFSDKPALLNYFKNVAPARPTQRR